MAVGRGSAKAPQFIIMEYRHPKAKYHLGLVGKGVTFDTGGLNVKIHGMVHMKSDMGGAAAVLATTKLIAELNFLLPTNRRCLWAKMLFAAILFRNCRQAAQTSS